LLDGRLLDESLHLALQVPHLRDRGHWHSPQQRCGGDELLTCSRWHVRVVGVDAVAGLPAQLPHVFAASGGFSIHRGAEQPHRAVLLRQLSLELAGLG
jgi:hypothetical protein